MNGRPVITKQLANMLSLSGNGSYSNEGNALQDTLYDTFQWPANYQQTINYYTQPIGAAYANGNKTINETNLNNPGQLPNGQTFIAIAMSIALKANCDDAAAGTNELWEDIMSSWYTIIGNSIFEVTIAGREYDYRVPGTELIPSVPVATLATAAVQRSGDFWTSGRVKYLSVPIVLGQMVTFSVRQTVNNQITAIIGTVLPSNFAILKAQDAEIQIRLHGFRTRSI